MQLPKSKQEEPGLREASGPCGNHTVQCVAAEAWGQCSVFSCVGVSCRQVRSHWQWPRSAVYLDFLGVLFACPEGRMGKRRNQTAHQWYNRTHKIQVKNVFSAFSPHPLEKAHNCNWITIKKKKKKRMCFLKWLRWGQGITVLYAVENIYLWPLTKSSWSEGKFRDGCVSTQNRFLIWACNWQDEVQNRQFSFTVGGLNHQCFSPAGQPAGIQALEKQPHPGSPPALWCPRGSLGSSMSLGCFMTQDHL